MSSTVGITHGPSPQPVTGQISNGSEGPVTPGPAAGNSSLTGGQFNSSLPTLADGDQAAIQLDSRGRLIVSPSSDNSVLVSVYNEVSSVAVNAVVTINTYVVPVGKTSYIQKVEFGGQNIATYDIFLNGVKIDRKRTYFGSDLSSELDFTFSGSGGYQMSSGDILTVKVTNFRPYIADFESRIQLVESG